MFYKHIKMYNVIDWSTYYQQIWVWESYCFITFYGCQCLRACESCPGSEDPCDTSNHRERALRGPLHCGIPRLILPTTFLSRFFPMDIRQYFFFQVSFGPIYSPLPPLRLLLNWPNWASTQCWSSPPNFPTVQCREPTQTLSCVSSDIGSQSDNRAFRRWFDKYLDGSKSEV